jgi:hypothetical protein
MKECLKKIMTTKMEGTRKRGRPRKRWIEEVEDHGNKKLACSG